MTEPTDARSVGQYDLSVAALAAVGGSLPALAVLDAAHKPSSAPSAAPLSEDAIAVVAACQARGVPVAVLVADTAARAEAERVLAASTIVPARVVVAPPSSSGTGAVADAGTAAALKELKAATGTPLGDVLLFSPSPAALRAASRLGATPARLPPGARGPDAAALRRALEAHGEKVADSRGY